jgi:hypothetical protein
LKPWLFKLVVNEITQDIKGKNEYRMGNREIHIIYYADELVLIAGHEGNSQRLLYQFFLSYQQNETKISISIKTKTITT